MKRRRRELEEGEEYCPVCGGISFPGACKPCRHYVALMWDGRIVNEIEPLVNLREAWLELGELRETFGEAGLDFDDCAAEVCKNLRIDSELVDVANYDDHDETSALEGIIDFELGETIITGGMLGGSGYNLYLDKKSTTLSGLTRDFRRLGAALRRKLTQLQKKHSSSQASL